MTHFTKWKNLGGFQGLPEFKFQSVSLLHFVAFGYRVFLVYSFYLFVTLYKAMLETVYLIKLAKKVSTIVK